MGNVALSVGVPNRPAQEGWEWVVLTELARLESGHTPSRNHPEYWGGDVRWIGIKDAKRFNGLEITETLETTNELGINNSSSRVLPKGTVCLSRTASVGYVVKMGIEMATSQDFANWVCGDRLDPDFLKYLFVAENAALDRFSSGSVHQTIYYPELKAFTVCIPPIRKQKRIVAVLDEALDGMARARANAEANLQNARELFESFLAAEFSRNTSDWRISELNDHVKFVDYRGKTPPKAERGIRLITAKNVKLGYINREPEEFIREGAYDAWMTRGFPEIGDVLFTTEAPLANVAQLNTDETVVIGQRLITMKADPAILAADFLKFALMSPPMQSEIHRRGTGATVVGIKASLLKTVPLAYPREVGIQREIAAKCQRVYDDAVTIQAAYSSKLKVLDELRQSLLQKAFAGELT